MNHTSKFRELVIDAHSRAATRESSSTHCLIVAYKSNGKQMIQAIIAAMSTLGGKHACIKDCYRMLHDLLNCSIKPSDLGLSIYPGFGSSFYKCRPDPNLKEIEDFMEDQWPKCYEAIQLLRNHIGKDVYPNLALYTACYALLCNIDIEFCEQVMIESRIPVWVEILRNL